MNEDNEMTRLKQTYREAKSSLRWIVLALILIIGGFIAELVTIFLIATSNPRWVFGMTTTIGLFVISMYCKWMSELSKPGSWK